MLIKKREESPLFEVSNTDAIAVNDYFHVNLDETTGYGKYTPFNFILIQNNSGQVVRVIVNDSVRKIIPAGTIQTFDASTIPAVWSIRVQNRGSTSITANQLQVSFQKVKGIKSTAVKLLGVDI